MRATYVDTRWDVTYNVTLYPLISLTPRTDEASIDLLTIYR